MEELIGNYYNSGKELNQSPFLAPASRKWGQNISLKVAILSALFLLISSVFSSPFFLLLTFFFAGVPALIGAMEDLAEGRLNIDVLMSLAAFVSLFIGSGAEGGLLLVLFAFASSLEKSVKSKAKGAIRSLERLTPSRAFVLRDDGSLIQRALSDIRIGEKILVKAGAVVPLDGRVIAGASSVSLVHLTGENIPVTKQMDDTVPAGAHNHEGSMTLEVTQESSNSTIARIVQLITEAQKAKPKVGLWLDSIMSRYATFVILATFAFALFIPLFFPVTFLGAKGSIYRALAFLIAASPCALILAIPIAYLSAISACAKKGIILKGGVVLDALAVCDRVALDKTGTVTTGKLVCQEVEDASDEMLALALALEQRSDHPIANAICSYVTQKGIAPAQIDNFSALFGKGVRADYQGDEAKITGCSGCEDEARVCACLSYRGEKIHFTFEDALRPRAQQTIKSLHELGLSTVMLSGDHQRSVKMIADQLGVGRYFAELTPAEKLEHIASHDKLVMVGDGINDAPALARAAIGISMGKMGNATAVDVSDIVLLNDRIDNLSWLFRKARLTKRIVKQNLALASCAILLAVLPALFGWIPLWLAVLLHEGGTVVVGLNALRLLSRR
ncbi:MAG: putative cadmium-transporting ATPase [Chlamydiales bacterium]|nr:putative cadmium-transporting ATPase [Chlamydiales bacterium]MCH9635708.1 putative cadmium-transporting ATPase [Chlamydiales bacterium]MCH9703549.1 cadmium-translocating P-type ATPase [Chlamydiota bacterium]